MDASITKRFSFVEAAVNGLGQGSKDDMSAEVVDAAKAQQQVEYLDSWLLSI